MVHLPTQQGHHVTKLAPTWWNDPRMCTHNKNNECIYLAHIMIIDHRPIEWMASMAIHLHIPLTSDPIFLCRATAVSCQRTHPLQRIFPPLPVTHSSQDRFGRRSGRSEYCLGSGACGGKDLPCLCCCFAQSSLKDGLVFMLNNLKKKLKMQVKT